MHVLAVGSTLQISISAAGQKPPSETLCHSMPQVHQPNGICSSRQHKCADYRQKDDTDHAMEKNV